MRAHKYIDKIISGFGFGHHHFSSIVAWRDSVLVLAYKKILAIQVDGIQITDKHISSNLL